MKLSAQRRATQDTGLGQMPPSNWKDGEKLSSQLSAVAIHSSAISEHATIIAAKPPVAPQPPRVAR